ncbi:hypothetical protein Purlil1_9415 [Purpureocillium lilacinum]|uniref:Uncharacterized protein n=1 Tax=Purpureocillium lilacinum TaxID=33203 RepID=A0ABR0BQL6_PURLI|nr:hypothetical protein Purlil1_9415 [Purpureocillium lilacinum]
MAPKRKVADVASEETDMGSENESNVDSVRLCGCRMAKKLRATKQELADSRAERRLLQNGLESAEKLAADSRKECQRLAAAIERDRFELDITNAAIASHSPDRQMMLEGTLRDAIRSQVDLLTRPEYMEAAIEQAVDKAFQEYVNERVAQVCRPILASVLPSHAVERYVRDAMATVVGLERGAM